MKQIIKDNLNNTLENGYVPELGKHIHGKVRDVHFTSEKIGDPIVMIASDRVSVFDQILNKNIPFKGNILNKFANWAFDNTEDIIQNARLKSPHPNVVVQKNCKNLMIECVVRGYVWGSIAGEYEEGQRELFGLTLPEGLLRYQKFDEPLFTPTMKSENDEHIDYAEVERLIGKELAKKVKDISLKLYNRGAELAEKQGLIFIDTKYEFGLDENDELTLIDEANTPDSSRYCEISEYKKFDKIKKEFKSKKYNDVSELLAKNPELKIKELSKQFVRDIITKKGYSYGSTGKVPELDDNDVIEIVQRYVELYEKLTGEKFVFPQTNVKSSLIESLKKEGYIEGQLVVIVAGSNSDMHHIEKIREALDKYGIKSIYRICSAHKQLLKANNMFGKYNDSIEQLVFVAIAGGTDALSGVASFYSLHPVISCPPTEYYESCLLNPPGSSNSTILKIPNLAKHIATIFASNNPEIKKKIVQFNQEKIKKLEESDNGL